MNTTIQRKDGRTALQLRPISISTGVLSFAEFSVLYSAGNTKVLVGVTRTYKVPSFMRGSKRGSKKGWLTAEYAMLPTATRERTIRETSLNKRYGRNIEISRLIGRVLRSCCDLSLLPDQTIMVDCDVLQADGSTRAAAICAAGYALEGLNKHLQQTGVISRSFLQDQPCALSIGVLEEQLILDMTQEEDMKASADFTIIMTKSNKVIEVHGTAEQNPLEWNMFHAMQEAAEVGLTFLPHYSPDSFSEEQKVME